MARARNRGVLHANEGRAIPTSAEAANRVALLRAAKVAGVAGNGQREALALRSRRRRCDGRRRRHHGRRRRDRHRPGRPPCGASRAAARRRGIARARRLEGTCDDRRRLRRAPRPRSLGPSRRRTREAPPRHPRRSLVARRRAPRPTRRHLWRRTQPRLRVRRGGGSRARRARRAPRDLRRGRPRRLEGRPDVATRALRSRLSRPGLPTGSCALAPSDREAPRRSSAPRALGVRRRSGR